MTRQNIRFDGAVQLGMPCVQEYTNGKMTRQNIRFDGVVWPSSNFRINYSNITAINSLLTSS